MSTAKLLALVHIVYTCMYKILWQNSHGIYMIVQGNVSVHIMLYMNVCRYIVSFVPFSRTFLIILYSLSLISWTGNMH